MPVQYPNYRYQLHPVFALVVNAPHFCQSRQFQFFVCFLGLRQLINEFEALGLSYIPSSSNFIAVNVDNANIFFQALLKKGFIVRPVVM
jgi:hypothetical protein